MEIELALIRDKPRVGLLGQPARSWGLILLRSAAAWCFAIVAIAVVAGCKPKLDSTDPNERAQAVKNLSDQSTLARVAVEDPYWNVRRDAVAKLTDQALLAKVSFESEDGIVRSAAVAMLTDQAVLTKVAIEDEEADVRRAAVRKLTDQAVLAKIAIEDKDSGVRHFAVAQLTNQSALAKVAVEDEEEYVRRVAVDQLTDQAVLAKVATEDKDRDVRRAAVDKLTDQPALTKVAIEEKDREVRRAAFGKLTDQAALDKVAVEEEDLEVRRVAVAKLTDQVVLTKVAVEDKDSNIRSAAVVRLTDPALLAKVALEGSDPAAYRKLGSASVLAELLADADPTTRRYASILSKIGAACQPIPEKHRGRLRGEVLEIASPLTDPLVTAELGDVEDISVAWRTDSRSYSGGPGIYGEDFTVSITLSKTDRVVSHRWATAFPQFATVEQVWKDAGVGELDFPLEICGLLSAPTLAKIAIESRKPFLRQAAVARLAELRR